MLSRKTMALIRVRALRKKSEKDPLTNAELTAYRKAVKEAKAD